MLDRRKKKSVEIRTLVPGTELRREKGIVQFLPYHGWEQALLDRQEMK
jgi:hypothetical protein